MFLNTLIFGGEPCVIQTNNTGVFVSLYFVYLTFLYFVLQNFV